MSASTKKAGFSGRNANKVAVPPKLDRNEVLQLKSATTRKSGEPDTEQYPGVDHEWDGRKS